MDPSKCPDSLRHTKWWHFDRSGIQSLLDIRDECGPPRLQPANSQTQTRSRNEARGTGTTPPNRRTQILNTQHYICSNRLHKHDICHDRPYHLFTLTQLHHPASQDPTKPHSVISKVARTRAMSESHLLRVFLGMLRWSHLKIQGNKGGREQNSK